jgi:ornithine cyclodeaminase/alanine dehydrogenase-like protein (mu-crystallin family)
VSDFASLPVVGAAALTDLLDEAAAVEALEQALRRGLDPAVGPARSSMSLPGGELLVMPAGFAGYAAVKLAGVAPGNPALGLPRITGACLLLDSCSLVPLALFDAAALTALRTPAVTALAARRLAPPDAQHLLLFGTGPQARGHLRALRTVLPLLRRVTVVARHPDRAQSFAREAAAYGLRIDACTPDAVRAAVADADVICCCTTARTPLLDGADVAPDTLAIAVGSHEPDARELDTALVRRATVVVEDRATALREAGDLMIPLAEGAFAAADIHADLAELITGAPLPDGRPRVFKSVGMAWQDLVVAAAAHRALLGRSG